MKMIMLIAILTLFSLKAFCPNERVLYIERMEGINIYDPLMRAITYVESRDDVWAFNFPEQACGPFQIRPIRIEHYNQLTGSNYKAWDCFDYEISRKVFLYFCKWRSYELVAKSWNGSGDMTIDYWNKVKSEL